MGLEAATYIQDLVSTNPAAGDDVSVGDDHIRLLKTVLKTTFPGADRLFPFREIYEKSANFNVLEDERNALYAISTTGGSWVATLPSLNNTHIGWEYFFVKSTTGANPYFIAPASGTLISGEVEAISRARRAVPGSFTRAVWQGLTNGWRLTRAVGLPVGSLIRMGLLSRRRVRIIPSIMQLSEVDYFQHKQDIS
jgi:hypothetical protein